MALTRESDRRQRSDIQTVSRHQAGILRHGKTRETVVSKAVFPVEEASETLVHVAQTLGAVFVELIVLFILPEVLLFATVFKIVLNDRVYH